MVCPECMARIDTRLGSGYVLLSERVRVVVCPVCGVACKVSLPSREQNKSAALNLIGWHRASPALVATMDETRK